MTFRLGGFGLFPYYSQYPIQPYFQPYIPYYQPYIPPYYQPYIPPYYQPYIQPYIQPYYQPYIQPYFHPRNPMIPLAMGPGFYPSYPMPRRILAPLIESEML